MSRTRFLLLFAVLGLLGIAWVARPVAQTLVSTGKPLEIPDDADPGYDENTVCMMAELVSGYVLPALDDRFFRSARGLKKLPETSREDWYRDSYAYTGDGVIGIVRRKGSAAFFQSFRIDGNRFPRALRSRRHLLDLLDWAEEASRTDDAALACDRWTVHLHFDGNVLDYGAFFDGRLSND